MVTSFHIYAEPEPGSLVRLLDPFAQRGLVPTTVRAVHHDDDLEVTIDLPELDSTIAGHLCDRMLNMIAVRYAVAYRSDERSGAILTQHPPGKSRA